MSDPLKITSEVQKLEPDALIELFVLDLTELGGELFYFHNQRVQGEGSLVYGGATFVAYPIEAKGFAFNGTEQLATPSISVASLNGLITGLVDQFDDLVGAKLTRIRTFRKHLADGSDPDDTARLSNDVFKVDRKGNQNKLWVDFELASSLDVAGILLPGRRCLVRCQWTFKDGVNCPYSGPNTTCAKTVAACVENFGEGAELPYGGFPGLDRVRLIT